MIKTFTFFLFLMLGSNIFGQVAMIKDKDGYTNVRNDSNLESKVIHKICESDLFFYDVTRDIDRSQWIKIYIPKNKYTLDCQDSDYITGFIHSTRILPINRLKEYNGNDFSFKYQLGLFSKRDKIIDYSDKWITKINGRPYFGADGGEPKIEVKSIDVIVNGNRINVPDMLYSDLFECTNDFQIYKYKDLFIVQQWNSDGAGGYLINWAIDCDEIRQRIIFIP